MSLALNPLTACAAPQIDAAALANPDTRWALHALIQTILCGEDTTREETPEQWRARVERMAMELSPTIYQAAT
jgi:hypothetical protein